MKKVLALVSVVVIATVLALTLVACSPAGTYKFDSLSYTSGGVSVEYKAGEEIASGVTIEADAATLELKKDGTYVFESKIPYFTISRQGKWTKDGDKISFDDDDFIATIDGKTLTADYNGMTIVMTR